MSPKHWRPPRTVVNEWLVARQHAGVTLALADAQAIKDMVQRKHAHRHGLCRGPAGNARQSMALHHTSHPNAL